MSEKLSLEERVKPNSSDDPIQNEPSAELEQRTNGLSYAIKSYMVDVTSAWIFYTPIVALSEYASGMESEKILKSRLISVGLQIFIARPLGVFRQYWANLWDAGQESTPLKKFAGDTSFQVLTQAPIYSGMLYLAGASFNQGVAAVSLGLAVGA